MIRLFKQVYLSPDTFFMWNRDRIVLSKNVGAQMAHQLDEVVQGASLYYNEQWDQEDMSFEQMIEFADDWTTKNDDKPLYIYADEDVFPQLLVTWLRNITPDITVDQVNQFYQSELFTSRNIEGRTGDDNLIEHDMFSYPDYKVESFEAVWEVQRASQSFLEWIEKNSESFELAFLIATYKSTGQYKDKLCKFFIRNVRHFVHKHLFDIKRELSQKVFSSDFADKMGCKVYDLNNLDQLEHDDSQLIEVFYGKRILEAVTLRNSNKGNKEGLGVNWSAITDQDIDSICRVVDITDIPIGVETTEELKWLISVARNTEVSDNDLDKILEREQSLNATDKNQNDKLIDYSVCSAMFINYMLQQDQPYIDKLRIV